MIHLKYSGDDGTTRSLDKDFQREAEKEGLDLWFNSGTGIYKNPKTEAAYQEFKKNK